MIRLAQAAMMVAVLQLFCFFFVPVPAARASFNYPQLYDKSISVAGSSTQILPQENNRRYLLIENLCTTANIGISLLPTTAAIGTTGTMTLFPGGSLEFKGSDVPVNGLNAIAASGSCAIGIWEIQ